MARTWEELKANGYIDSRDILERLEELEGMEERDEDETAELEILREADKAGQDYASDWQYGASLIPRRDFVEYAQELADDIGAIDREAGWPASYIDWGAAAAALEQDYSEVEIDGTEYLVRS